jgi:Fe-S-cluster containining protein
MNCIRCRGACCELIHVDASHCGFPKVAVEQFEMRGTHIKGMIYAMVAPCPKMTSEGLCGVQDEKPLACAIMPVGGEDCFSSVKLRRTPEEYAVIRDEDDPERIHGSVEVVNV